MPDEIKAALSPEAPAEGAGEAMDAGFEAWLNERNLLPNGAWDWPSIVAMLNHHEDALRADAERLREAASLLDDCIWLDHDTGDYRVEHDGSVERARAILAALAALKA